jgi:hypothetical protein
VLKPTVTVRRVVPASSTVKLAPPPSLATVSLIERDGCAFLSTIVPCPCASATPAPTAPTRLRSTVSLSSFVVSPSTETVTGRDV